MGAINQRINHIAVEFFSDNNSLFAKRMDTSEANIRNYRKDTTPKVDFIVKLHEELEISFDWVMIGKGEMKEKAIAERTNYPLRTDRNEEMQMVPLYDFKAAAGLTQIFNSDHQNILDYISIPNLPKVDGAIHMVGDSMYPLLKSGDIIIYKQVKDILNGIYWGEMYVLYISLNQEDYTTVKYIQRSDRSDEYVKLVSQNQHHSPKEIPIHSIKALALVKASIRINSMA